MEVSKLKKDTIERLRKVRKEQEFTIAHILELLEQKGYYLSEATVNRVFSENADADSFKYRDTIAPLADVLLDFYDDQSCTDEVEALKSMIRVKNMTISILIAKNEEIRADFEKRIAHLQKQIDRIEKNLDFREKVVERKDAVIEKLINKVIDSNSTDE
jgi:transcriptional regulator with XRE-family HTH domain